MTCLTQSEIKLTEEQQKVADAIIERCLAGKHTSLVGLAGSGKTTVARHIYDTLRDRMKVLPMAPTGKAASVLRDKGVEAHTIHSVIYKFKGSFVDDDGDEQLLFEPNKGDIYADLLMVDESSMVSASQFEDIMKKGVPTLWIGDPGQLPPVMSEPTGLLEKPNFVLRKIHRQALDNPIIAWAHDLRKGKCINQPANGIRRVHLDGQGSKFIAEKMIELGIDAIITKTNAQRVAINKAVCKLTDGHYSIPAEGSRLICLRNDRITGLVNGDLLDVVETHSPECLTVRRISNGEILDISIASIQLNNPKRFDLKAEGYRFGTIQADYGYAMTCHKMQGSSARHVGIVAHGYCGNAAQWNYTAATRAEEQVTVFC
jgi:exodeoxyribonuclease-5